MNMHSEFSEWFRAAGLPLQDAELQKRWAGVEALQINRDEVVSLVEVFFGYFENHDTFLAKFRKAFQDEDSSFRMRDNNLELSVLAGATLVTAMEGESVDFGDFATMAVVTCAAQNLRGTPCVAEIPEIAVKYMARRTVKRGQIPEEVEDADENPLEVRQLRRDLDIIGEESNILWWVFGETSRDTNKRWSDYDVSRAALMAGKELANLTRVAPGPASAAALLDRVLKGRKAKPPSPLSVKDAITGASTEWRQAYIKENYVTALANLSPVSHGIKLSVDLADGEAWVQALVSFTKMSGGKKIAPSLLAYQVYLECLLVTTWKKLG